MKEKEMIPIDIKDKKGVKKNSNLKELGESLRYFRKDLKKYKQDELAKEMGLTRVYINEIERGKWMPSYNFFRRFSMVFPDAIINIEIKDGAISAIIGN